jgi:hypothetical protein
MSFNVQAGTTNKAENFTSELNLAEPIKLGKELEVKLIISPESAHVGKQADLILVLEYWRNTEDKMTFYRDVEGNWQIWTATEKLPPATRTYKKLPTKIAETTGSFGTAGRISLVCGLCTTDGNVVSRSEALVFVVE